LETRLAEITAGHAEVKRIVAATRLARQEIMKRITVLLLVGAAALLLSGCYGYGPHMGWGYQGGHMNGYRTDGNPAAPCNQDGRGGQNGPPCRTSP